MINVGLTQAHHNNYAWLIISICEYHCCACASKESFLIIESLLMGLIVNYIRGKLVSIVVLNIGQMTKQVA